MGLEMQSKGWPVLMEDQATGLISVSMTREPCQHIGAPTTRMITGWGAGLEILKEIDLAKLKPF